MKKQTTFLVAVFAICFLCYQCTTPSDHTTANNDSSISNTNVYAGYASQTLWGEHLVKTAGCGDCHTPKKMTPKGPVDDSSLLLAGNLKVPAPEITSSEMAKGTAATYDNTAWIGPWGKSYAANITPDSTGILSWSEQQFITCIQKGLFQGIEGSRPIMPPMPVESYRNFKEDELKAIFAYIKTVKPVHNVVAQYQPPAGAPK